MKNPIVWADIPAVDLERAMAFYAHVTGTNVVPMSGATDIAVFEPADGQDAVGADIYAGGTPSEAGVTVYLGTNGDIDGMLARVTEAGGEVIQEKQFMGDMVGWIAFIRDTEGNRVGVQQPA
jgi:predicted enzyme related to lactoylglutathione lyase